MNLICEVLLSPAGDNVMTNKIIDIIYLYKDNN